MAASPNAGDARCASLGVMRALSRVVVLGGLVVAGWLLGSGISLASEELGQPGTNLVQLASDTDVRAAQSDDGSSGQLSAPPAVTAAVTTVRSAVSQPLRPVQPPVKLGIVQPIVNALDAPTPLATLSGPAKYSAGIRSQAPANEPMTVPPAETAVRAAPATAPAPALGATTVLTTVGHTAPARATTPALPTDLFAKQLALGDHPGAPVPASPPASTTSPCITAGTGSSAGTKSIPDIAANDSWATAGLPSNRLLCLRASDLPRSPAAQPSTPPD